MGEFRHVGEFFHGMLDEDFVRFGIDGGEQFELLLRCFEADDGLLLDDGTLEDVSVDAKMGVESCKLEGGAGQNGSAVPALQRVDVFW